MRPLFVLTALAFTAGLLQAQSSLSPDQLADWQRNRTTVLAYIDAMPDSATGFRPTPGVRSFARQFHHIVTTNLEVAAVALKGQKAAPALGDSSVYLHDKAALRKYAAATYDYFLKALQEAKPAQLSKRVAIYGSPPSRRVVSRCSRTSTRSGRSARSYLTFGSTESSRPNTACRSDRWQRSTSRLSLALSGCSAGCNEPECSAGLSLPLCAGAGTRRNSSQYQCVPARRAARAAAVPAHAHALRHRRRHGRARRLPVPRRPTATSSSPRTSAAGTTARASSS